MMLGAVVTPEAYAQLLRAQQAAPDRWLDFDAAVIARDYNRLPFLMQHRLHQHPGFELDALRALCNRLPASNWICRRAVVPIDAHFDTSLPRYAEPIGIDQAFAELEARQLYIAVYNPERDPEFRVIIEGLLGEIAAATDAIEHRINWYSTYLFISAQDAVTPYHMDREMNFLLQIRGHKTVRLWDPNDDRVMSPADRDYLFSWAEDSRPVYRPELEALAVRFELAPGLGVHHPFIAPHLVHTGPELSVSLAVTFRTPRSDRQTNAHRFNQNLRRHIGVAAGQVGKFAAIDEAKAMAMLTAGRVKRLLKGSQAQG
jgi:hypothetical protein